MTMHKSTSIPAGSYPYAVLIPEGQYAQFPPIAVGRALTLIGSEDTVHVRLRSRTISPVHALLLNADGRVILRDLASHSHVYVNSRLVREAVLSEGDKIRVGRIRFVFRPGEKAGHENIAELPPAQLWNSSGKIVSIKSSIFVIGRRRDTDLVVQNTPEPAHAVIFTIGGQRFLRHLKLSAPISLNDNEIRQSLLDQGDVIDIYGEKYQFTLAAAESEQANEMSEALELSTVVQQTSPALAEASIAHSEFESQDQPMQPEFDAGISPSLSALETQSDSLATAAAALVAETESFDASLRSANDLVDETPMPAMNQRMGEPRESLLASDSPQEEFPRLIPLDKPPMEFAASSDEKLDDRVAGDAVAPGMEAAARLMQDLPPRTDDPEHPEHPPIGLNVTDEMLPFLKEWGPLAMAMLAEQRPDALPEPAAEIKPAPRNRRKAWVSMVAAIALAVGVGAWLTFRGTF
jgi:pSer/pThr/pTyr-binding forkhead associated (FHA) protein